MKYKKYILILFLLIFIGWNRVEASDKDTDCFYISNGLAVQVDSSKGDAYVDRKGWEMIENWRKESIENLKKDKNIELAFKEIVLDRDEFKFTMPKYVSNNKCPEYIIFYIDSKMTGKYHVYASTNEQLAIDFKKRVNKYFTESRVYYASNIPNMTREEYFDKFMDGIYSYNGVLLEENEICDLSDPNCSVNEVCKKIFGVKTDEDSIRYMIDSILLYIRIIVPILIILLGSLDFAKAVLSGKEDEMKKAQTTFMKRLIAGVVVFFVPVIVDLVMSLADMIWDYSFCEF